MKDNRKNYALIYIDGKKPIKKQYDSVMRAFYDYKDRSCTKVELYDSFNQLLASYEPKK